MVRRINLVNTGCDPIKYSRAIFKDIAITSWGVIGRVSGSGFSRSSISTGAPVVANLSINDSATGKGMCLKPPLFQIAFKSATSSSISRLSFTRLESAPSKKSSTHTCLYEPCKLLPPKMSNMYIKRSRLVSNFLGQVVGSSGSIIFVERSLRFLELTFGAAA